MKLKKKIGIIGGVVLCVVLADIGHSGDERFIGSGTCKACHETEYNSYITHSKKAHSYESIKKMEAKLTPEEYQSCFECHTTGYGKPGGFVSETTTPHLKNAGCEVCHGPGSRHVESEDPDDIDWDLDIDICNKCHNVERVESFRFKPLIFGGAH